jgi:NitT/TauT family transport system permease protein
MSKPPVSPEAKPAPVAERKLPSSRPPVGILLALPAAAVVALLIHQLVSKTEPVAATRVYSWFLVLILGIGMAEALMQSLSPALRGWVRFKSPVFAAALLLLSVWEIITSGFRWLPLPYFPGPSAVLRSLIDDRRMLFESTCRSLVLLLSGYALGVVIALITGVCIGWFRRGRYWGMPLVKVLGPIPATAWVPLAMVLSPSGTFAAIGLIALAVWFPVTMLTISGIANTRASYLDVARTLGAGPGYLIFRIAIPAALPSIFIGLFMGLGTSFLTLIVAETVGVKSGLGWYLSWAQGWAEYGKVYAALVIMAAFFSGIMTVLFKVRDRVLAWQKGVIKW